MAMDAAAVQKEALQSFLTRSGGGLWEIGLETLRPSWAPVPPSQVRSPGTTTEWRQEAWDLLSVWTRSRN